MKRSIHPSRLRLAPLILLLAILPTAPSPAQQPPPATPVPKAPEATDKQPELPARIELLETHVRFEATGDSRKEVHTRVHINNELGVRQFALLSFDYNRSFQQIEIPLVRITHASGGTADILPGAISDQPNPAVVNAAAYQDVRVKSVRILGLEPGDTLEYRVVTTISHHPLAPDFWLDHTFDRSGVISHETFLLDLPNSVAKIQISPETKPISTDRPGEGVSARTIYRWDRDFSAGRGDETMAAANGPDVVVTSFVSWPQVSTQLSKLLPSSSSDAGIAAQAGELSAAAKSTREKLEAFYRFVSQKIRTVPLPLDATGFRPRLPAEILASKYATALDKYVLFSALAMAAKVPSTAALSGIPDVEEPPLFRPSIFTRLLIVCGADRPFFWLDPSLEIAPFAVLPPDLRGKRALLIYRMKEGVGETFRWENTPKDLPFASSQNVTIDAVLAADGALSARVHYALRGDNELLLRVAFHQSPKEKWREVAQLLALSDGFRGKITSVTASDPYATKAPFTVEYEITQPKFVDWSKKPVRIPALLPLVGLPDPPAKSASPIELGTPLDVETRLALRLPPDTTVRTPTGTSVVRDYATFASKYTASRTTVTAERHINFLERQLPASSAADYSAFVHAVQSDQAQEFTLDRPGVSPPRPTPANSPASAPASKPTP